MDALLYAPLAAWAWVKAHPYTTLGLLNMALNVVTLVFLFVLFRAVVRNTKAAKVNTKAALEHMELAKRWAEAANGQSLEAQKILKRSEAETRVASTLLSGRIEEALTRKP